MKTPESLHTKILDAARDEVAREMQYTNWFSFTGSEKFRRGPWVFDKRAFDKAMEKQAEFYHAVSLKWTWFEDEKMWYHGIEASLTNPKSSYITKKTELELYNIWREATTQQ